MNLTPWISRVKPLRGELLAAYAIAVVIAGIVLVGTRAGDDRVEAQRAMLSALADGLAQLAVEPLAGRDRIRLGVLANRLIDLPDIRGVTVYTVDEEPLAISGAVQGPDAVIAPIVRDDAVMGYVRLYPEPVSDAAAPASGVLAIIALAVLLVPALVVALRHVSLPARGRIAEVADEIVVEETPAHPRYVLVANLFNQLSLAPEQRARELEHAAALAATAVALYSGKVRALPGTGLLIELDASEDPDRPFQVICAALLLARLAAAGEPLGQYRFGAHATLLPPAAPLASDAAAVSDAALLSAIARNGTVAVSTALHDAVNRAERLRSEALVNPLLDQLESADPEARLVTGLEGAHAELLDAQVRELGYDLDSTSSESAF